MTLAEAVAHADCEPGELGREEALALHAFKHSLSASLYGLYQVLPEARADAMLRQLIDRVLAK